MDRHEAIKLLKRCEAESHCGHYKQRLCCKGCNQREALNMAIEALSEPSIVRCKDCRYRELDGDDWCRITARPVDDTDYCAWGLESEVEE